MKNKCPICTEDIKRGDIVAINIKFNALCGYFNGEVIKLPHLVDYTIKNNRETFIHQSCIKSMFNFANLEFDDRKMVRPEPREVINVNSQKP